MNKILPHNAEAEESIISSCLLGGYKEPCATLEPSDFYKIAHQKIFISIQSLASTNKPIDLITVIDALTQKKELEDCGGAAKISKFINTIPVASSITHYCKIIKEKALKRQIISRCNDLMQNCFNDNHIGDLLEEAKYVSELGETGLINRKRKVDLSNVYDAKRMLLEYDLYVKTLKNNRFITGIGEIDKRIRGVAGGETLFIIARAGAYKTALLQNLLRNYVNNSAWGAVFFSIEMPIPNIAERYLQQFDRSPGYYIEQHYANNDEDSISALEKRFRNDLKRFFVVPTKVSLSDIEQYIKLIEDSKQLKIGLIGIDYMQLIDEPGKEYEQITKIARGSKDLAKYLNIPVIVLSQINRQGEDGNTEVSLSMGRGSGAIEEAADFMFGLWKNNEDLICKILKNRKGSAGSMWKLELDSNCFLIGQNAVRYFKTKNKKSNGYCD
jgi:replicative DNA helicase